MGPGYTAASAIWTPLSSVRSAKASLHVPVVKPLLSRVLRFCTAALLWAASGCVGTESGNPPLARVRLISLAVESGQVLIEGAPGAASPPGARVEAINVSRRTSAPRDTLVNSDGSFGLSVPGERGDSLRLVVFELGRHSPVVLLETVVPDQVACAAPSSTEVDVFDGQATVVFENNCAEDVVTAPEFVRGNIDFSPTPTAIPAGETHRFTFDATIAQGEHGLVIFETAIGSVVAESAVSIFAPAPR